MARFRDIHGKERIPAERESVVTGINRQLFGVHSQAVGDHGGVFANLGKQFVLSVNQREGSAHARRSARGGQPADTHCEFGLVQRLHGDFATAHHSIFSDLRRALRMRDKDGNRAGEADLAARTADAAGERLRAQQAAVFAVHVLRQCGSNAHIAVVLGSGRVALGGHIAAEDSVGLIAVHGNRHTDGNIVGIFVKHRHRRAGTQRAVIGAVFGVDLYRLGRKATANFSRCDVFGNGRARRRGNVELLPLLRALVKFLAGRAAVLRHGTHGAGSRTGCGRISWQLHVELLHEHRQQRKSGNGVGARLHGRASKAVDLVHDGNIQSGHRLAKAQRVEDVANAAEVAVEIGTDHGRQTGRFVLIGGERFHLGFAGNNAIAKEGGAHIGIGEIDAYRRANRGLAAHRETGGSAVGLSALEGAQVEVDRFNFVGGNVRFRGDDVTARQAQPGAGTDNGMHHVVNHRKRHGSVHGDVLGGGVVLLNRHLAKGGRFLRHLVAAGDRIAAGDGDGIDIVANFGNNAQSARFQVAIFAQQGLRGHVDIRNRRRCADANALTLGVAGAILVLVGHAVFVRRGSGSGVNLLRSLRVNSDRAVHVNVGRPGEARLVRDDSLRIGLD